MTTAVDGEVPRAIEAALPSPITAGAGGSPGRCLGNSGSWACAPPYVPRSPCMQ
jgi:hypothetical protein